MAAWSQTAEVSKASPSVAELALYTGADRQARLIAGAKKEGTLTVYHVYPALTKVMAAFTQKYDIKTKAWRAGSEAVLQRVISEARGNKFEVDIVQNNAPENEAASREKLLQEVRSSFQQDLIAQAVPAHKEWTGITVDVWTAAYNTGKIKKEDLPKTYDDLLSPKWKGQLGIEGNNHAWFGALMAQMGEDKGLALFNNKLMRLVQLALQLLAKRHRPVCPCRRSCRVKSYRAGTDQLTGDRVAGTTASPSRRFSSEVEQPPCKR